MVYCVTLCDECGLDYRRTRVSDASMCRRTVGLDRSRVLGCGGGWLRSFRRASLSSSSRFHARSCTMHTIMKTLSNTGHRGWSRERVDTGRGPSFHVDFLPNCACSWW
jgi:hypothetical protein